MVRGVARYNRFDMRTRKNTVLLFSKVPEVGLVKTRLSVLKDGIFKPEDTCNLYHRMLFDVAEVTCAALNDLEALAAAAAEAAELLGEEPVLDTYEFRISTTPAENEPVMRKLFEDAGQWPHEIVFDYDEGIDFDAHYNGAFQKAFDDGADAVISFGADMPALTKADIIGAFEALHDLDVEPQGGVVIAPDQEMGVSLVGWLRRTPFDHSGVYYCRNGLTVLPAYIQKAKEAGLPVRYLPALPDVDTMADLRHNATLVEALCYSQQFEPQIEGGAGYSPVPHRTQQWLAAFGWDQVKVMPNNLFDPRDAIDK